LVDSLAQGINVDDGAVPTLVQPALGVMLQLGDLLIETLEPQIDIAAEIIPLGVDIVPGVPGFIADLAGGVTDGIVSFVFLVLRGEASPAAEDLD
jgi:hypothetical protein